MSGSVEFIIPWLSTNCQWLFVQKQFNSFGIKGYDSIVVIDHMYFLFFENHHFGTGLLKFGLLFNPTSGHSGICMQTRH